MAVVTRAAVSLRVDELAQVVAELAPTLPGATVQKAHSPFAKLCYLELRLPGRTVTLCLCAEAEVARLSIASSRLPSPVEPTTFQRWLRQELTGAKLVCLEQPGALVIALRFEVGEKRRSLFGELNRSHGLLILAAEEDRVLAISGEIHGKARELRPGLPYAPPDPAPDSAERGAVALPVRLVAAPGASFPLAEAAERLFFARDQARRVEGIRKRLLGPLKAQLARTSRTLEKVRAEADRAPAAEEHRRSGELLSQNLHRVQRGQREITLTEYTAEGPVERALALDPTLAPKDQVERQFHQYRRLLRGVEHARTRLVQLGLEQARLTEAIQKIQSTDDAQLLSSDWGAPAAAREPTARPYKEFQGSHGERIWVGKSSSTNDVLTFKIARPQDLWLHARGVPGSHVVVPLEKGAELPQELLLDAAHLALHYSSAKGEPRGEVSYTLVKFVRKAKGGSPGQVTYSREKSFLVRLEPARLQRLLGSSPS